MARSTVRELRWRRLSISRVARLQRRGSGRERWARVSFDPGVWSVRVAGGIVFARCTFAVVLAPGFGAWRRSFWCRRRRLLCISCATTSRMGRPRGPSCSARGTRICIRWCHGLSGWSRWRLVGSCGRWGARWLGSGRCRGSRFRSWGCGLPVPRLWSRSSRRRSFLEGLLATGHPAGLAGIFGFGGWWSIPGRSLCWSCAGGGVSRRPVGP